MRFLLTILLFSCSKEYSQTGRCGPMQAGQSAATKKWIVMIPYHDRWNEFEIDSTSYMNKWQYEIGEVHCSHEFE